jgi:C1A family cysteine protease
MTKQKNRKKLQIEENMKKILLLLIFVLLGCGKNNFFDDLGLDSNILGELRTGWLASEENFSTIPQDIMSFSGNTSSLQPSISLENKFPPIGNQGQYGTCVAWAVGYNLKTALNGIEKNWSSSDLAKAANQTSPKDLWMTIPSGSKGSNCGGTSFEAALNALILKGGASLTDVPYSNMGSCSGTSNGNENNKLANYRKIAYNESLYEGSSSRIEGMELSNFKGYLAQGRPIVIGARLGDRFMRWNSSAVISSDTYNDPGMQHAYHAMALSGYDDSKGAFRVRNSWDDDWGDRGSIWVDYNFFLSNFCFAAFVAQNPNAEPPKDEQQLSSGYDLLASYAEDFPNPKSANARDRAFSYDVFNIGSSLILASQKWTVLYMYYNAYNANEYQIIFEDYYTNEYGKSGDYGKYTGTQALVGGLWNNVDVAPGKKAGEAEFGEEGFYIPYTMPSITGDYYLVAYADAYDKIQESNEDNNFYFITAENGKPLKFSNGVMQSKPANLAVASSNVLNKKLGRTAPAASVAELGELNGYTPQEIKSLLNQSKQNGTMAKKIMEFRENSPAPIKIPRKR